MFVGREKEIRQLNRMYAKDGFQMAVIYGRRRVGKTTLIDAFAKDKPTLYFTAQQRSSLQNLVQFSRAAYAFFGLPEDTGAFPDWRSAFSYVADSARRQGGRPLLFVFDEFPYAAETEPSLPSILQIAIDHEFADTNVRMILCGSNEGFMESEVLGRKSPLYGRRTMRLKVKPFDCFDASLMLPGLTAEQWVTYYATFGGTPYYLAQINQAATYEENVTELMFDTAGILYEEPLMLLRQEMREPALYNSILDAIGSGETRPKRIAERSGVNASSLPKYLKTLIDLGIIEREVPFGENPATSRRALYSLADPYFAYWYAFVSKNVGAIEVGAGIAAARKTAFGQALQTYVGKQFGTVCRQWAVRENSEGGLPFLASSFGRWWGTDPREKAETDIDLVVADKESKSILLGECKWRNSLDESRAIELLEYRSALVRGYEHRTYCLFTKNAANGVLREKAGSRSDLRLVSASDMFAVR